jgi:hypothetical protein
LKDLSPRGDEYRKKCVTLRAKACENGLRLSNLNKFDCVRLAPSLDQITQRGYAEKYRLDGRPVTKVGIAFSSEERNITDWQAETATL